MVTERLIGRLKDERDPERGEERSNWSRCPTRLARLRARSRWTGVNLKATDEERPETPEEIEEWIRWFHSLEPIVMTAEEEAVWEADLKAQKEFDNAPERDRQIEGIFLSYVNGPEHIVS
jgi:hypothetical protein